MELTPVKSLVQLAEMLNFTHAAKPLFITQSTLSVSIRRLEEELGVKPSGPAGKKVHLTEEGRMSAEYARKASGQISESVQRSYAARQIYRRKLSAGIQLRNTESTSGALHREIPEIYLTVMRFMTVETAFHRSSDGQFSLEHILSEILPEAPRTDCRTAKAVRRQHRAQGSPLPAWLA